LPLVEVIAPRTATVVVDQAAIAQLAVALGDGGVVLDEFKLDLDILDLFAVAVAIGGAVVLAVVAAVICSRFISRRVRAWCDGEYINSPYSQ
jgi:hypothetical protein